LELGRGDSHVKIIRLLRPGKGKRSEKRVEGGGLPSRLRMAEKGKAGRKGRRERAPDGHANRCLFVETEKKYGARNIVRGHFLCLRVPKTDIFHGKLSGIMEKGN